MDNDIFLVSRLDITEFDSSMCLFLSVGIVCAGNKSVDVCGSILARGDILLYLLLSLCYGKFNTVLVCVIDLCLKAELGDFSWEYLIFNSGNILCRLECDRPA